MKDLFQSSLELVSNWVTAYRDQVDSYPVLSSAKPGELLERLPCLPSETAESFDRIFEDFKSLIVPGITHWQHPKFFGYFPSNSSPPSVLAELLVAAMGVQGMSWATSPAATELEVRMMEWLREMFGLPSEFSGVIQDSASSSTHVAMIVARERCSDFDINVQGYAGRSLVAYCSSEAHSSVEKAAKMIGIGSQGLRKIPVNDRQEMCLDQLEQQIKDDLKNGFKPFFVVGAFGTTSTTAVDSIDGVGQIARRYGLWFHVDAAYAGAALVLPECREMARGIEMADSVVVNPHKWLLTTFDCSAFFIKDQTALIKSFSILPEYLKTPEGDEVVNFRDWGPGLGRRFRSLKLWFVIRWYGVEGIRKILREHLALAQRLEAWVIEDNRFELIATRKFNLVCFALKQGDEATRLLMEEINASGKLFVSHTRINGRFALRMAVGQTDVNALHLKQAWKDLQEVAQEVLER